MDADAIAMVNKRVSDLDDYKTAADAGIYFGSDQSALDDAAKADLSKLADIALSLDGYMIEIAGYASTTGTKQLNQKLSEERAAAVTQYLRERKISRCGASSRPLGTVPHIQPHRTVTRKGAP